MRINEILTKKRTLSFEVFPPKKGKEDIEKLYKTIRELKELNPDFVTLIILKIIHLHFYL